MNAPYWLLAQTSADPEEMERVVYEFARLNAFDDPRWVVAALVAVGVGLAAFVWWMYRRDAAELKRPIRITLAALRIAALAGMVLYFLHLEKRSVQEAVHNSRVIVLIDTSQSMGVRDGATGESLADASRSEMIARQLESGTLLPLLRRTHDVTIMRFDSQTVRLATLAKFDGGEEDVAGEIRLDPAALSNALDPDAIDPDGVNPDAGGPDAGDPDAIDPGEGAIEPAPSTKIVWEEILAPQGMESRIGEALRNVVNDQRDSPLAGIIVITDGAQNAGIDPEAAVAIAAEASIPIYTIGLGTDERPRNVRVSDVLAPARAYPGDLFTITASIQAQSFTSRAVNVELFSRDAADGQGVESLEGSRRLTLGGDSEVTPVAFDVTPEMAGRRTYSVRVEAPSEDRNATDNRFEVDVDVVDQETRVLLVAGGPTREYQFLRNQLHRDKTIVVDVVLQSAQDGASQDANSTLGSFPSTKEDLYQYDCIVAFDPDWTELSTDELELLEGWVADEAGGLVVIAGPIYTRKWTRQSRMSPLLKLYPVIFHDRILLDDADYGTTTPWPVGLTREGLEAEFLWIEDDGALSAQAWRRFPGVFGHYNVRGVKPGATVYARFTDPQAVQGGQPPVYYAGHIYGSGRVFYMGSGEMWRLRSDDDAYFERLYTKLIRHVSQGRLLRGSSRGMLLVERERFLLGETISVRAQLSDRQHEPLSDPNVTLQVTRPDGSVQTVLMDMDPNRQGTYRGQFTALQEGAFRLDLPLPDAIDEQLTRRIQIRVPDLERESPQRNDALLSSIATGTGGLYYVGMNEALGEEGGKPVAGQLRDRTEITRLLSAPDEGFTRRLMYGLLGVICGALFLEWLIRRLCKLA